MGCLINLSALAAAMFLLCRLGSLLAEAFGMADDAEKTSLLCVLLYGISTGAVASVLLIRMYSLLTLWCVAYFYIVVKKWLNVEFDRQNFSLIMVTVLGFWTQYFFLFYCILLAVTVCVLLLRRKRVMELWKFVRSMVIAAVVGVVLFPFSVLTVLFSDRGEEAFGSLAAGLSGYGARLWAYFKIICESTFHSFFWVLLLILAVWAFVAGRTGERILKIKAGITQEKSALLWMLLLPPAGYYLLAARATPYLVDRYVMPIFPFVSVVGTLLFVKALSALKRRMAKERQRWFINLFCGLALVLQLISVMRYDGHYLYQGYALQEGVAERNADYPCICIYDDVGYYENLPEFTYYEKTLLLTLDQLENRQERDSILRLEKVAVLIKERESYEVTGQVLKILEEQYGFVQEKWGWRGLGAHGDILIFMRKDV